MDARWISLWNSFLLIGTIITQVLAEMLLTKYLFSTYTTNTSIACAARLPEVCLYFHSLAEDKYQLVELVFCLESEDKDVRRKQKEAFLGKKLPP